MKALNKEANENTDFKYTYKLRIAIIGFVLYLLLSTELSFKILGLIVYTFYNDNTFIINEKNEPTFLAKFIMAVIIFITLFIF